MTDFYFILLCECKYNGEYLGNVLGHLCMLEMSAFLYWLLTIKLCEYDITNVLKKYCDSQVLSSNTKKMITKKGQQISIC